MSKKSSINQILKFLSYLFAFVSLGFFTFLRVPFLSNSVSLDMSKSLALLSLSTIAILLYIISIARKKEVLLPKNKLAKIMLGVFPVLVLLSVAFSGSFSDSLFAKYDFLQSGVTLLAVFFSAFIVSSGFKTYERLSWILFILGGFFITLPVILALIFSKLGAAGFAAGIVYFVESWDIVSVLAAIIILASLLYYELIASSKGQKLFSAIVAILHLVLLFFIIIPDIWYILTLSSLFIFFFTKNQKQNDREETRFYERFSFYIFAFSLLMSIIFAFSSSFTSSISNSLYNFTTRVVGVEYSFIKPNLGLSMEIVGSQIKEGRFFGSGPAEFYKAWQKNKPQSVIDSELWGVEFTSSYSSLTTLAVTLGIIGALGVLAYIVSIALSILKVLKNKERYNHILNEGDETRFYFLLSVTLFIFSVLLALFFVNVALAFVLLALSSAIVVSKTIDWKEYKLSNIYLIVAFIVFLVILVGIVVTSNKVRAAHITEKALASYQVTENLDELEIGLAKAARISGDDNNYRLLSQFYLFKTRMILNTSTEDMDIEVLQNEVLNSINNAINSSKTAIRLDNTDYNNYLTLGSVYTFLMSIDQANKDVIYESAKEIYDAAIALYPKNPSLFLNLADLEYTYNQDSSSTITDTIQKSLEVKPNYSSAYFLFSQLAAQNNDRDTAIKYAEQAIEANPRDAQAYLQYGILTLANEELTEEELNMAYTSFLAVMTLEPNNTVGAYYLALTYTLAGEYNNAKSLLSSLEEILPGNEQILELKKFISETESAATLETNSSENTSDIEEEISEIEEGEE